MNRRTKFGILMAFGVSTMLAGVALTQSVETSGQASGTATARGALEKNAPAAAASAEADASAKAEARARLDAIVQRGAKTSAKARAEAESKLHASAKQVDAHAATAGDQKIAERFAAEFGTSVEAVLVEKQSLGASWGELMIAHTLLANAGSEITIDQLFEMRQKGGWGVIAAGLGLRLGDVVSAAKAESRVALGLVRADGKVSAVRGSGAGAHGAVGAGVGAGASGVGASASTRVGVGVRLKP